MIENEPSLEELNVLYQLISELKALGPWEWMAEQDLFAVENPETHEIGFVSIMGSVGEHFSLAVYKGNEALQKFWAFQSDPVDETAFQRLMEIPQLQASFEDRDYLDPKDRDIIKALGLRFRGKQAWPMFRTYVPGFVPWFLSSAEARFFTHVLKQTLEVAARVKDDPGMLIPAEDNSYFLRKPTGNGDDIQWRDAVWHETPPEPEAYHLAMDWDTIQKFNSLKTRNAELEIDVFMSPAGVYEKNEKPFFPYVILAVEPTHGMIVGNELMPPRPDLKSMWEQVPYTILEILIKASFKPEKMYTSSELLFQLFEAMQDDLDVPVVLVEDLILAKEAKQTMLEFMQKG